MKIFALFTLSAIIALVGCSKKNGNSTHSWVFNGSTWSATSIPPNCSKPLNLVAPIDVSLASSILMPGQTRGGDFKPHGGFALDTQPNGLVEVITPLSAEVVNGAKYTEGGELQYLFTFINKCGIAYRMDHLKTLSPKLQAIADTLPLGGEGDSRTSPLFGHTVEEGDLLASEVGVSDNYFFDFGLYDLRQKNTASQDSAWAALYPAELAHYGVCWLDELAEPSKSTVAGLPIRNSDSSSDYCD